MAKTFRPVLALVLVSAAMPAYAEDAAVDAAANTEGAGESN